MRAPLGGRELMQRRTISTYPEVAGVFDADSCFLLARGCHASGGAASSRSMVPRGHRSAKNTKHGEDSRPRGRGRGARARAFQIDTSGANVDSYTPRSGACACWRALLGYCSIGRGRFT